MSSASRCSRRWRSGKPITQARGEIAGAADLWRYAAALARDAARRQPQHARAPTCWRRAEGADRRRLDHHAVELPVLDPVSQKLPFALAAGCTCVVKPSETDPVHHGDAGRAADRGRACRPASSTSCSATASRSARRWPRIPRVDMVTFTGSTAVGKAIMAGGRRQTLKKVALELGGKNPQVIFPDADLDSAADAVVFGVYFNAGECCNSGSRIIVHEDIAEDFIAARRGAVAAGGVRRSAGPGDAGRRHHHAGASAPRSTAMCRPPRRRGRTVALGGGPLRRAGPRRAVLPADRS